MLSSNYRKKILSKSMNEGNSVRHILAIESNSGKKNFFLDKNTYTLGRNATNTIVLYHRVISRNHATLLKVTYQGVQGNNSVFWVIDGDLKGNRSTNGIYVNGHKCLSHQLKPGDLILFGGVEVRAKYDIVDLNSRTFFSVTKNDYLQFATGENSELDDDKPTSVTIKELNKEPLIEEFTKVINEFKNPETYYYVVINSQGKIREISKLLEENIPNVNTLKIKHPLFNDFNFNSLENHHKLLVRDFDLENKSFTQYIYYSEKSDLITTYLLTRTQKQQIEIKLRENEERYYNIIKQISEGIFFVDIETKQIVEVNNAYCQLLGYSEAEILNLKLDNLFAVDQAILANDLSYIINHKTTLVRESTHRRHDNSVINVEMSISLVIYSGKETLCFCVRDITERKKVEELLRYQTVHDSITNLPNQKLFKEQLLANIANNKEEQKRLALILLKFNELSQIKYALGNEVSNELLSMLAKVIKGCLAIGDGLARWADDEFIILLPEVNSETDIQNVIEKMLEELKYPLAINDLSFYLTNSIGIVVYPDHGKNDSKLLRNLNIALLESHNLSGNNYRFYHDDLQTPFTEQFNLKTSFYSAINQHNFYLKYNPRFNLNTNEVCALNSNIKCQSENEKLNNLSDLDLLTLSEEIGLSKTIFHWYLETICESYQRWKQENIDLPIINLKICLSTLESSDLVPQINHLLEDNNIDFENLELEIVNIKLMNNADLIMQNLMLLSQQGIKICLSNFDLEKLTNISDTELPINSIKISQKISSNLEHNIYNQSLVKGIIELGKSLSINVFAENVNSQEVLNILSEFDCREMTGEMFSKPLLSNQILNFLKKTYKL